MPDSFDKESKLSERRAARQRQMRLMEEAASGLTHAPGATAAAGVGFGATGGGGGAAASSSMDTADLLGAGMGSDVMGGGVGTGVGVGSVGAGTDNVMSEWSGTSGGLPPGNPPTMSDIELSNTTGSSTGGGGGMFSIDDDYESDAGPPSVFTDSNSTSRSSSRDGGLASNTRKLRASSLLWGSKTGTSLDNEKLGFITGSSSDDNNSYSKKSKSSSFWRNNHQADGNHDSSRDLILMASRRLSNEARSSSFNSRDADDAWHERTSSRIRLPPWCMIHRRAIFGILMVCTLWIVLFSVADYNRKNKSSARGNGYGGGATTSPWEENPLPEVDDPLLNGSQGQQRLDQMKFNRIKDRILTHSISHASTLEEPSTPQYKALRWIVRDDPRQLDLPARDDESPGITGADIDAEQTLFQRYALAVLWYQTSDLQIVQQSMTGSHVENPFENPFDPLELTEEDIKWKKDTNWMSEKGLCLWEGVTCHPHEAYGERFDGDFYVSILNLTGNNAHGIVPQEVFTGFGKLKALDLSKNELEGTIGGELGQLGDLEDLFLFDNNFSGVLPDNVGNLANLYNLYINDNKFRGKLPSTIGDLTKLRGASLFNNTFEGRIPDSIGNLKDVIALYLDENKFTGQIPTTMGDMTSLIDLRLRINNLSGSIPTELGNLNNLETIYLDTNAKISGPIPVELSNLKKLSELHMYEMDLNGSLPKELALLDGLIYLYLDNNDLTGQIPEDWGQMGNLEQLFLTGNNLNGPLPESVRGLTSLEMLRAADNELSGPIPTDLGKLTKLEYVYLEDNNFTGEVPSELAELTKLKTMHLHDSRLSGNMPPEICNLMDQFFLTELTADCKEVICDCCACDN